MRLAAWNCRRGGHRKLAARVEAYHPDVVVMPEWGDHPPVLPPAECSLIGFGETGVRGMAVVGLQGYTVTASDVPPAPWPTVGAVDVDGPHPIRLLAAWANFDPVPDENPVVAAVAAWSEWLTAPGPPVVVAGDFNSGGGWHDQVTAMDHYAVVRTLSGLGLVSAFHHARGLEQGVDEEPTFWMYGHQNRPHHVDHVFAAAPAVREGDHRRMGGLVRQGRPLGPRPHGRGPRLDLPEQHGEALPSPRAHRSQSDWPGKTVAHRPSCDGP